MNIDLRGRVNNLPLALTRPLAPLFEAIVNAIQATVRTEKARISIQVQRDGEQLEADLQDGSHSPVNGFIIEDNGVGFTAANYQSFTTSDSTYKAKLGGKGVSVQGTMPKTTTNDRSTYN